jgi:PadR family transcriptional regulator PadR
MILATLAESEAHGYAVGQAIKGRSDGVFDLPEGSIYPALHRLERSGLLSSKWSKGEGRKRRVYRLTARGRKAVGEQRDEWRRFATAVEAVIA